MSPNRLEIPIPLLFRNIVLRLLLLSSLAHLITQVFIQISAIHMGFSPSASTWGLYVVVPILIILHHNLRLWPRVYWLNICEVLFSLAEVVTSSYFFAPPLPTTIKQIKSGNTIFLNGNSLAIFTGAFAFAIPVFSFTAFLVLLCDILKDRGKNMLRPYDFSAGLCPPGRQWNFICGKFVTRKRFNTDNPFIRSARAVLAFLCFFAISALVVYALILQPLEWNGRQGVKISKMAVDSEGAFSINALQIATGNLPVAVLPLQVVLTATNVSATYPTVNLTQSYVGHSTDINECKNSTDSRGTVYIQCFPVLIPFRPDLITEILIAIDFPEVSNGNRVYLGITNSTDDILAGAQPIDIVPGSNLYGLSSFSVKEQILNQQAATFGIPQYRRFAVINTHFLFPDPSPSLPRGNNTFTLRIRMQFQPYIVIEQEYIENSVINGFALVGGVWTLINGTFAAIFGSTLLLVLFGIKPLSIYGLVHLFRPGRGSLADGGYTLSPEERDRIVKILREHLLDVEGDEKDGTSSSHYSAVNALPQSTCSRCGCEAPA